MAEYFNKSLYLRNLKRFWPLAVAVFVVAFFFFVLVAMVANFAVQTFDVDGNQPAVDIIAPLAAYAGSMAPIFSILTAIAMFGYLHRPKSAGFLSSLPISRLGIYITNILSGLTIMLVPTLLIGIINALLLIGRSVPTSHFVLWFAAIIFMHLFYFSLAVFCTFLTGKPVMQAFLYVFLQVVVTLIGVIIEFVTDVLVFGYDTVIPIATMSSDTPQIFWWAFLVPVQAIVYIIGNLPDIAETISIYPIHSIVNLLIFPILTGLLLFFGYLLYKRRRIESAESVIVHKAMRSVFKYLIGFFMGSLLGFTLTTIVSTGAGISMLTFVITLTISAAIFGALGCLFTEMLIKKRFRVWKSAWKSMVFLSLGFMAIMLFVRLDATGYERHVPNPDNVVAVTVTTSRGAVSNILFYDIDYVLSVESEFSLTGRGWDLRTGVWAPTASLSTRPETFMWNDEIINEIKMRTPDFFETPEAIYAVTEFHRAIVENRRHLEDYTLHPTPGHTFFITYKMNDGQFVVRQYRLPVDAIISLGIAESLYALITQEEVLEKRNRFMTLPDSAILWAEAMLVLDSNDVFTPTGVNAAFSYITEEMLLYILAAMRKDVEEGTLGRVGGGNLWFFYEYSLTLTENPENIIIELFYEFAESGVYQQFRPTQRRYRDSDESVNVFPQEIIITHYDRNTMQVIRDLGLFDEPEWEMGE